MIFAEPSQVPGVYVDHEGGFSFRHLPDGLIRLRAVAPNGATAKSEWVWL